MYKKTSPLLISDIKEKLISLRDMIECPIEDLDVECPVYNKNIEDSYKCSSKFVKNPLDVLDYLKKNFSEWKNYYGSHDDTNKIEQEQGSKDNIRVLRTIGKNLNKFTINKSKGLEFTKETDNQTHKYDLQCNNYPKIIRNITLLDTFEEKIKRNKRCLNYPEANKNISSISFDGNKNIAIVNDRVVETNDFEIVSVNNDPKNNDSRNIDSKNKDLKINDSKNNDLNNNDLNNNDLNNNDLNNNDSKNNDLNNNDSKNNDSKNNDLNNNDSKNNDSNNNNVSINDINDPTKDSGFDSNSLFTYSLVRTFLSELCSSFITVHTFIDETRKNYNEDIDEENKRTLYDKANKTHKHVLDIMDKLKIIIQRETKESSTLKSLLIKAGTDDKRTTRYRPVVMKCLEQAKILEKSLKLIISLINDEELLSVDSSEENLDLINIFE